MTLQQRSVERQPRRLKLYAEAAFLVFCICVLISTTWTHDWSSNSASKPAASLPTDPVRFVSFEENQGESVAFFDENADLEERKLQTKRIRRLPVLDTPQGVTRFYAIADIPYAADQLVLLQDQMNKLPSDAEFLVHLGDIKSGKNTNCVVQDYTSVAQALKTSRVPVFIVPGDNEWNDCADPNLAWQYWSSTFMLFEDNWSHNFKVARMKKFNETFAFINKGTLFMGFNIVGGRIFNATEWDIRLSSQAKWAIKMMKYYDNVTSVGRVVMFGHADPTPAHALFYDPIKQYVTNDLRNQIPILVINGDGHIWQYQPTFFSPATSMLRVMLTSSGSRPPHQCTVNATGQAATLTQAFQCKY